MRRMTTSAMAGLLLLGMHGVVGLAHVGAQSVPTCMGFAATAFLTSPGTLTGTIGNDVLVGSSGADVISGLSGDDLICGEADKEPTGERDFIYGGRGNDNMIGGPGDDTIEGDAGLDRTPSFDGPSGDGPNSLIDAGDDRLRGGSGDDIFFDFHGNNDADGGPGQDQVIVSGTAHGGDDDDVRVIAFNDDYRDYADCGCTPYASGDSGNDREVIVRGSGGIADGGPGNDGISDSLSGEHVTGSHGADEVRGGTGHDVLVAGDRGMVLNGGSGRDACYRNSAAGITFISCEVQGNAPPP